MFGTKNAGAGINLVRVEKGQKKVFAPGKSNRGTHMMVPCLERQVP